MTLYCAWCPTKFADNTPIATILKHVKEAHNLTLNDLIIMKIERILDENE